MKTALGIFLGVIIGFTADSLLKFVGQSLQPLPEYIYKADMETIRSYYEESGFWNFLYLPVGWLLSSTLGAYLSERISDWINGVAGAITGLLMYSIGLLFLTVGPQPGWAWWVLGLSFFAGTTLGVFLGLTSKQNDKEQL